MAIFIFPRKTESGSIKFYGLFTLALDQSAGRQYKYNIRIIHFILFFQVSFATENPFEMITSTLERGYKIK